MMSVINHLVQKSIENPRSGGGKGKSTEPNKLRDSFDRLVSTQRVVSGFGSLGFLPWKIDFPSSAGLAVDPWLRVGTARRITGERDRLSPHLGPEASSKESEVRRKSAFICPSSAVAATEDGRNLRIKPGLPAEREPAGPQPLLHILLVRIECM